MGELSRGGAFSYGRYMGAERTVREAWRRHIVGLLDQALERNDAAISGVAGAITTTVLAGRHVYAFGAGHSLALVSEMYRGAGLGAWRPVLGDLQLGPERAGRRARAGGQAARCHRGGPGFRGALGRGVGGARPAEAARDRRLPA